MYIYIYMFHFGVCFASVRSFSSSLKPLFSRQNLLKSFELRKMMGERGRGGCSNSKRGRPPSARYSINSRKSGSFHGAYRWQEKVGPSATSVGSADGNSQSGGPQHGKMLQGPVAHAEVPIEGGVAHAEVPIEGGVAHAEVPIEGGVAHAKVPIEGGASVNCSSYLQIECDEAKESECLAKTSDHAKNFEYFDICFNRELDARKTPVKLNPSFLAKNKEKRRELERSKNGFQALKLRPGMILFKNYLEHSNQVEIVEECCKIGRGPGGFYHPRYSDGAKMHLHMMCLGKNWDPETRQYGDKRSFDDAQPPPIPDKFKLLVEKVLKDSHDFIERNSKGLVEDVIPIMKPDLCIVNFYSDTGKLGLHQDKDETQGSLRKGLPVVSFSIGDSAEFLYGDDRDVDKARRERLESGDVLIFGGKSRHIFHGVPSIKPETAPKLLVNETGLRPGRLNLTFRQY